MTIITVKGHAINAVVAKDSCNRRAQGYANTLITALKKIGITEDDYDLKLENVCMKKAPASVSFYLDGRHLFYSYSRGAKYVDNLFVVLKVIEAEVNDLLNDKITAEEFINTFSEEKDVLNKRKEARALLGVEESHDLAHINKKYKALAKESHPDMPNGDLENFKKLNNAHKLLKKELL